MNTQSLKIALVAISLVSFSVACSHKNDSPTKTDPGAVAAKNAKDNAAKLTSVFSQIDQTYDFNNRTLADKIEGLDLDSVYQTVPTIDGVGYAKASLLVKGVDTPVSMDSGKLTEADLKSGKPVSLTVSGQAEPQVEEVVGGPLTVTLKCLDGECKQVAVYFRIYQGAGYIFEKNDEGAYHIVNSIGPVQPLEQAVALRGVKTATN